MLNSILQIPGKALDAAYYAGFREGALITALIAIVIHLFLTRKTDG